MPPIPMVTESVKVMGALVIVLGIFFLGTHLFRKYSNNFSASGQTVKVLSGTSVGSKEKILLVEVDEQRLLLGVTTNQISLLQNLSSSGSAASTEVNDFQEHLKTCTENS